MFSKKARVSPFPSLEADDLKRVVLEGHPSRISSLGTKEDSQDRQISTSPNFEFSLPCKLALRLAPSGKSDLQLQLIDFRWGSETSTERRKHQQKSNSHSVAALPSSSRSSRPFPSRLLEASLRAGGLLAAKAMFPSLPLLPIAIVSETAVKALPPALQLARDLRSPSPPRPSLPPLKTLARRSLLWAHRSLRDSQDLCEGAALLAVLCAAVRVASPDWDHALRALLALVPVGAGYLRLSRQCELRRLPPGPQQERAWRAQHQWAARRLAPFLGDLDERPKFAFLVQIAQRLTLLYSQAPSSTPLLSSASSSLHPSPDLGTLVAFSYDLQARAVLTESSYLNLQPSAPTAKSSTRHRPRSKTIAPPSGRGTPVPVNSSAASGLETPLELVDFETGRPMDLAEAVRVRMASEAGSSAVTPSAPSTPLRAQNGRFSTSCAAAQPMDPPKENDGLKNRLLGSPGQQNNGGGYGGAGRSPLHDRSARPSFSSSSHPPPFSSLEAAAQSHPMLRRQPLQSRLDLEAMFEEETAAERARTFEVPQGLSLFGRDDHANREDREGALSVKERLELASRATWLVAVFFPFLVLGTALLLASRVVSSLPRIDNAVTASPTKRQNSRKTASAESFSSSSSSITDTTSTRADANNTALAPLPAPHGPSPSSPSRPVSAWMRLAAWKLLLTGCRNSGVAFIKWGQWASTRGDLYPQDLCDALAELQDRAPTHSFADTRRIVEQNLGRKLEDIFASFDPEPLASGSVAQVYRAELRVPGGGLRTVAVKVRHPKVATRIHQDFQLLKPLARASKGIPALRPFNLDESVRQFSHTMTAQADLRVEAVHLTRARAEFRHQHRTVSIPRPLAGFATEAVLVESFEHGESVAQFIRNPSPLNSKIVSLGLDTYLRMILCRGLVHTDLHPGNILARIRDPSTPGQASAPPKRLSQLLAETSPEELLQKDLQLVLLDYGLAEEMSPSVRHNFLSFLFTLASGNGRRAAEILLNWAPHQECPRPEAFKQDMEALYRERCDVRKEEGVDVDAVLKEILRVARRHEVTVDGSLASLLIGVVVICGFASSLDPGFNLIDAATPVFASYNLMGILIGRKL